MSTSAPQTPRVHFVHPLLRARDWQDRPEFGELCDWWQGGGVGLCALVGIGGAGKTAIADWFLQVLPGVLPDHPLVPKRSDLPTPGRLLVFSFYDAPNPDSFFAELSAWLAPSITPSPLEGDGRGEGLSVVPNRAPSYQQTLIAFHRAGRVLLVLDGLEKVQDDGVRDGVFGELQDGRLSDLLVRVAEGYLPTLSVLITSRFPLAELDERGSVYYRPIAVEDIEPAAAVALLRQRNVRGTDDQLRSIAADCGHHALTVDLAGGFIAEFGGGDPTTPLSLTRFDDEEQARRAEPTNARRRRVRLQEYRFARIAERYREGFKDSDPAALALLERICLFRLGVTADMLASIFTGDGEEKQRIAGPALAGLTREQLQRTLDRLVAMRLVESTKPSGSQPSTLSSRPSYSIHPAVRDGFLAGLDSDTRRQGHEAARTGLNAVLGEQPGENPSDRATLDLLEEILYHTLQSGHVSEAWDIYWNRIGGYNNLGRRLGAYERGIRISQVLAERMLGEPTDEAGSLRSHAVPFLTFAWGLYLSAVGRLDNATTRLRLAAERAESNDDWFDAALGCHNFARTALLAGKLVQAVEWSKKGVALLSRDERQLNAGEWVYHFGYLAQMLALHGDIVQALSTFQKAQDCVHSWLKPEMPLVGQEGVFLAQLLARLGRSTESQGLIKANVSASGLMWGKGHHQIPKCNLVLADLHRDAGDVAPAEELWAAARDWAVARDAKEVLCWSALVQARVELAKAASKLHAQANELSAREDSTLALQASKIALEDGMKIARDCGFGIYHIDLLLERARLHLLCGNPQAALDDLRVALDDGVPANADTGQPELLAATDPECGYPWGIAEGGHLLAESLLLKAAQEHGQPDFAPARLDQLPQSVRELIAKGREQLKAALELWRKLRDPESKADINPQGEKTQHAIRQLEGGVMTHYPLSPGSAENESEEFWRKELPRLMSELPDVVERLTELADTLEAVGLSPEMRTIIGQLLHQPDRQPGVITQAFTALVRIKSPDVALRGCVRSIAELLGRVMAHSRKKVGATELRSEISQLRALVKHTRSALHKATADTGPDKRRKPVPKKHLFLSYCRDNKAEVAMLRADLIAAGESVWWDQDILPGQAWELEIDNAMKSAYAVVLCFSKETEGRTTTGIYPEARNAIEAYRQYSPSEIFLIPVRLSDCEIPPFKIDGTTKLDGLQHEDLFPPSKRSDGLNRLIEALGRAPHHP